MANITLHNQTSIGLSGDTLILPEVESIGSVNVSINVVGSGTLRPSSNETINGNTGNYSLAAGKYILFTTGSQNAGWSITSSVSSGGGVTSIVAGTNITISPSNGLGDVTVNSSGGGASIAVNNQTPVSSGTLELAIPKQPSIPIGSVLQPLPPSSSLAGNGVGSNYLNGNPPVQVFNVSASAITNFVLAPDNTVWICHSNNILKQVTLGGSLVNTVTLANNADDVIIGSDHELWCITTDSSGSTGIDGKITKVKISDGSFTKTVYSVPGIANSFMSIVGADGKIYNTNYSGNPGEGIVNVINTSGTVTKLITTTTSPAFLCNDKFGNVWYTSYFLDSSTHEVIGKITPNGTITEYTMPRTSNVQQIVCGSDGYLYWTINGATGNLDGYIHNHGYLLKIDPSTGIIISSVDFGVGNPASGYTALTASDGNIWVDWGGGFYVYTLGDTSLNGSRSVTSNFSNGYLGVGINMPDSSIWGRASGTGNLAKLPLLPTTVARNSVTPKTIINGSISGTLTWSMPEQGESYKVFIACMDNFNDNNSTTITFPTPFTITPSYINSNGGAAPSSISTTTYSVGNTSGAHTGTVLVIGI